MFPVSLAGYFPAMGAGLFQLFLITGHWPETEIEVYTNNINALQSAIIMSHSLHGFQPYTVDVFM